VFLPNQKAQQQMMKLRQDCTLVTVFAIGVLAVLPSSIFSILFWHFFQGSVGAISHHIHLAFSAVGLFACGSAVFLSISRSVFVTRWIVPVAIAIWCTGLTSLYASFFVALLAWGRLPTVELLSVYVLQLGGLIGAIGVPSFVVISGVGMVVMAIAVGYFFAARVAIRRSEDIGSFRARGMTSLVLLIALFWAQHLWVELLVFRSSPIPDEPFHIFLNSKSRHPNEHALIAILGKIGDPSRREKEQMIQAAYAPSKPIARRNVILISVDALRPDHLGAYGYERDTTPFLDQELRAGRLHVVKEARAACAESTCGILSLLSGKQPHELNDLNFGLPEVLALHGYVRYFLLSGDHTNFYGLRKAYGDLDLYRDGTTTGRYVNDDYGLLEQAEQLPIASAEKSYFFYFHLMSVHGLGRRHPEHVRFLPQRSLYVPGTDAARVDSSEIKNFYDNGVLQMDTVIKRLFEALRVKGYLLEDTIVLITADHGESLGQHGIATHAATLYESVIRIPWMWYGRSGHAALTSPTIQADFAPTILSMLGMQAPQHWSGVDQSSKAKRNYSFHAQAPHAAILFYEKESVKVVHNFETGFSETFRPSIDKLERPQVLHESDRHYVERALNLLRENSYVGLAGSQSK
jgi:glucan phosphoethanolaminetransferase (alkaline phosphatase superfamily)